MDSVEFDRLLNLAKLTKKSFAEINELHKNSVTNWKQKEIPGWVKPWLENYIKGQAFDKLINTAEQLKKKIE